MNRTSHAFVNQLLVYSLVLLSFGGSLGLGTVWLRHRIAVTANSIKAHEQQLTEAGRRSAELRASIATEQRPEILEQRNLAWNLGLVRPAEPQVVRVDDDVQLRLIANRNRELLARDAAFTEAADEPFAVRIQLEPGTAGGQQPYQLTTRTAAVTPAPVAFATAPAAAGAGAEAPHIQFRFRREGGR